MITALPLNLFNDFTSKIKHNPSNSRAIMAELLLLIGQLEAENISSPKGVACGNGKLKIINDKKKKSETKNSFRSLSN